MISHAPTTIADMLSDLLYAHDRIIVFGGPNTGKTTLCKAMVDDRLLVHTDDWKPPPNPGPRWLPGMTYESIPKHICAVFRGAEQAVVEGVRGTGVMREGFDATGLLYLTEPKVELTPRQEAMRKACDTKLRKWWHEQRKLPADKRVEVLCEVRPKWMR